jgi:hypothetical protein
VLSLLFLLKKPHCLLLLIVSSLCPGENFKSLSFPMNWITTDQRREDIPETGSHCVKYLIRVLLSPGNEDLFLVIELFRMWGDPK